MIKTDKLTKHYGPLVAVDDMSFSVEPGEVLGFLGPNGAGKSTTMKMIAGFVAPSSGSVSVNGHDVSTEALKAKKCIGYLPEGAPSYGEMTTLGFLDFIADIRGLDGKRKKQRLDTMIEQLHLSPVLHQTIDTLSKGFKRRVGLAQAILHDPSVLILDEPTDGLDPNQKQEVRTLISKMASDKIIVISTHILEEMDAVCNRAIIISSGKILADESPKDLQARSRHHNAVTLRFKDADIVPSARADLETLDVVDRVEKDGASDRLTAFPAGNGLVLPAVNAMVQSKGWELDELTLEAGRLDEVFRDITTGSTQ